MTPKQQLQKTTDVLCVGSATRDVLFYTDQVEIIKNPKKDPTRLELFTTELGAKLRSDDVHFEFGGGAANTAVNFRGLGLKTGIATAVGSDHDGEAVFRMLMSKRIDTQFVRLSREHRTGFSFILTDAATGERSIYVHYGAVSDLNLTKTTVRKMHTKWFYISSISGKQWKSAMKLLTEQAEHTGAHIAWNPGGTQLAAGYNGLKQHLKKTSILILNRDEASELILSSGEVKKVGTMRQMLKRIHAWGPSIVVITDGKKGSMVYDGMEYYKQAAPVDKPVSTVGAGDCFGSSFVAGMIRYKGNIPKSLKLAQRNATSVVHSIGAQQGLLKWKDLPKSLQQ